MNGEPLSEDQLLDIKSVYFSFSNLHATCKNNLFVNFLFSVDPMVKSRPPSATSIPAILKLLQDEWVRTQLCVT